MLKNLKKNQEGFTIIEVMIVLVIAAVILLIVFLAIPALQRSSRNTQRTNDGARTASLVNECLGNRNGQVASCDTAAEFNWNAAEFGQLTTSPGVSTTATAPTSGTAQAGVWFSRVCTADGSGATATGATARDAAILFTLEPAQTRCVKVS